MTSMSAGGSILAFEGGPSGTVEFAGAEDARTLRALLDGRAGQPMSVTLAPVDTETDVEGHAQGQSVALTLHVDDDTAGHAINVHFPTAADAARFRRNLILTGALAGSIVLGSAGAMVISSQAGSPVDTGSQGRTPTYERPAGHGMLEGVDPASTVSTAAAASAAAAAASTVGASSIIDPATGRPADRGFLEGADGAVPGTAAAAAAASATDPATGGSADRGFSGVDGGLTGGGAPEAANPSTSRPTGAGPLEGADE